MRFATPQRLLSNSRYRGKVYSLTSDKKLQREYYERISKMLRHRGGSNGEDLCLYNTRSGKWCISTSGKKRSRPEYTDAIKKFITNSKNNEIIAFHNHPESTPPSISDLNAAFRNGYKEAFTIGHNGNIYRYTPPKTEIDSIIFEKRLEKYIRMGYNTNDSMMRTYKDLQPLYEFNIVEVI